MDINPAVRAYTNVYIEEENDMPKQKPSIGLLSRSLKSKSVDKTTPKEPKDSVYNYVKTIRKARKRIKNG
tara:strand:+ start:489 stop:698 length:210 start_codon:yes stop_codon:yes gene_type:complete